MNILKALQYIRVAFLVVLPFTVLAEDSGRPGDEKKKMVVESLKDTLSKLGFVLPDWAVKYQDFVLGAVVDVVVAILNRLGFFEHSGTTEPASK